MAELKHSEITGAIIKAFYQVYNSLGFGFLEKVYENAMAIELRHLGQTVFQQKPIAVHYKGAVVGEYFADLLVNEVVLVELKVAAKIEDAHEAQLLNYLRATNIEIGLLLTLGKSRITNARSIQMKKPLISYLIEQ